MVIDEVGYCKGGKLLYPCNTRLFAGDDNQGALNQLIIIRHKTTYIEIDTL